MSRRSVARALAGLVLVLGTVAGTAAPAAAGGTWLAPVRDRYEIGGSATLVGYVGRGTLGWLEDGPFYGYLYEAGMSPGVPAHAGEPLGPLTVEETGDTGWTALRVSIEVPLTGLPAGRYEVGYCNDPCRDGLGDLIGSRPINVGVEPGEPFTREWPLDEPLIGILQPDALVSGPGYQAPAREIWAGRVVPATPAPPVPSVPAALPVPVTVAPTPVNSSPPPPVAYVAPTTMVEVPPQPQFTPDTASASGSSPVALLFGIAIAAACTGGVLLALRRDGMSAYATRRYDGFSRTSSPTTHAPASSATSS